MPLKAIRNPKNYLLLWIIVLVIFSGFLFWAVRWYLHSQKQQTIHSLTDISYNLSNAVTENFINDMMETQYDASDLRYRNYINQLMLYQSHLQCENIFVLAVENHQVRIALATTPELMDYEIGNIYLDEGQIFDASSQIQLPVVSKPYFIDELQVITVLTPIKLSLDNAMELYIGVDFQASRFTKQLNKGKTQAVILISIFLLFNIFFIALIYWRDNQSVDIGTKLRHIESVAILLNFSLFLFIAVRITDRIDTIERQTSFRNVALPVQQNLHSALSELKKNLATVVSFIQNSESVEPEEFESFTQSLFGTDLLETLLYYQSVDEEDERQIEHTLPTIRLQHRPFYLANQYNPKQHISVAQFVKDHNKAIQRVQLSAFLSGKPSASRLLSDRNDTLTENLILVALPFYKWDKAEDHLKTYELDGVLLAVVNPQYILKTVFSKSYFAHDIIALALVELLSDTQSEYLTGLPEAHLQHVGQDIGLTHLNGLSSKNVLPLFLFNKTYLIVAHTIRAEVGYFKNIRLITILVFGVLAVVAIFFVVAFLKNRWASLELLVANQTLALRQRLTDMSYLKKISDERHQQHSIESFLTVIIGILREVFPSTESKFVSLRLNDVEYGESISETPDSIQISAKISGGEAGDGQICVVSRGADRFIEENQEFINQIAVSVSSWLSHERVLHQLRESEERFHALIENAFDGIYLVEGTQFVYANKSFLNMLGYSKEELLSDTFSMDVLLTDKSKEIVERRRIARAQNKEIPARYEFQQRTKTGTIQDVEVSTLALTLGGKKVIMGIIRDMTEKNQTQLKLIESEELLQQQNEELRVMNNELTLSNEQVRKMNHELIIAKKKAEASDQIKTQFLNNISHEVRTPLNGIVGAASLLGDSHSADEEIRELTTIINQSTRRLLQTITQYVDIALLHSDEMKRHDETFDISEIVSKLVNDYTSEAISKQLRLNVNISLKKRERKITTDKELVEKILVHLLDNAVKFTHKGGIDLLVSRIHHHLVFELKDTGIGIDPEFQKQIFDFFTQEDSGSRRQYDGNGLGLAICKGLTRLLGGSIFFNSIKHQGSTFVVQLPITEYYTASYPIEQDSTDKEKDVELGPTILIAEDEDSNFSVVSILFKKKLNARILRAENGREAIELVKEHPEINLVVMDLKMPFVDGFAATKEIKALRAELPVIALTAHGITGDESKALAAGCDEYFAKPININELIEAIQRYLNRN